jgi:hypothetical protein
MKVWIRFNCFKTESVAVPSEHKEELWEFISAEWDFLSDERILATQEDLSTESLQGSQIVNAKRLGSTSL